MSETVDRYRLGERIGSDSLSRTHEALVRDERGERTVHLRIAKLPQLGRDLLRRFEDDARVAITLTHENILGLEAYGVHRGVPYLVHPPLRTKTLRELLDADPQKRLPPAWVARIALDIATALEHSHGRDPAVLHRGLSPEGIVVDGDGIARIADFALPSLFNACAMTYSQVLEHTCRYSSPEQAKQRSSSAASDVFALGATLYEALAGRPAFNAPTPLAIVLKISMGMVDALKDVAKDTPPALAAIVTKMMTADPARRASARDVVIALEEIVGRDRAVRIELGRRVAPASTPVSPPAPSISTPLTDVLTDDDDAGLGELASESTRLDVVAPPEPPEPPPMRAPPPPARPSMPPEYDVDALAAFDAIPGEPTRTDALSPDTVELASPTDQSVWVEKTKPLEVAPTMIAPSPFEGRPTRPLGVMSATPQLARPVEEAPAPAPSADGWPVLLVVALGLGAVAVVVVVAALTAWIAS